MAKSGTRTALLIALQLGAAALALFSVVAFRLSRLLAPSYAVTDWAMLLSAGAIVILTMLVMMARPHSPRWLAALVAATLAAGLVPWAVEAARHYGDVQAENQERRRIETEFLDKLAAQRKDIAARIASNQPRTPEQAFDFLLFVNGSDLSYRSLPDYSAEALALLRQALDARIIDPNGRVTAGPYKRLNGLPLFLYFYRSQVKPGIDANALRIKEWDLLMTIVRAGADLSLPEAASLNEDLRKTPVPGASETFIRLR